MVTAMPIPKSPGRPVATPAGRRLAESHGMRRSLAGQESGDPRPEVEWLEGGRRGRRAGWRSVPARTSTRSCWLPITTCRVVDLDVSGRTAAGDGTGGRAGASRTINDGQPRLRGPRPTAA